MFEMKFIRSNIVLFSKILCVKLSNNLVRDNGNVELFIVIINNNTIT